MEVTPGSWEVTELLRSFEVSADGKEIDNGGSGPNVENVCVAGHTLKVSSLYPGLKFPPVAARCKVSTISETPNLIESAIRCTGKIPTVEHALVIAPTPKSITVIRDKTFTQALYNGDIARSITNVRAKWLKKACEH
jgi:hypothetical protein